MRHTLSAPYLLSPFHPLPLLPGALWELCRCAGVVSVSALPRLLGILRPMAASAYATAAAVACLRSSIYLSCACRDPRYPDVKVMQAAVLCQLLSSVSEQAEEHGQASSSETARPGPGSPRSRQGPHLPIIVAGDFNSLPIKRKPDVFDRVGGLV